MKTEIVNLMADVLELMDQAEACTSSASSVHEDPLDFAGQRPETRLVSALQDAFDAIVDSVREGCPPGTKWEIAKRKVESVRCSTIRLS